MLSLTFSLSQNAFHWLLTVFVGLKICICTQRGLTLISYLLLHWIPQSGCSRLNPRSLWREQRMWFLLPNLFLGFLHFQVPSISVAFSWLSLSIAACLWWLILCINLSGSQGVHIFWLNIFFWLCLYRCFWMGFEAIDWVKQIALPNVGGFHPIYRGPWIEQKRWQVENSLFIQLFELRHQSSPMLGLEPSALCFQAFGLKLNCITSSSGSSACRWQIMRLLNCHNHVSNSL